jgi:hypothetical protein
MPLDAFELFVILSRLGSASQRGQRFVIQIAGVIPLRLLSTAGHVRDRSNIVLLTRTGWGGVGHGSVGYVTAKKASTMIIIGRSSM